MNRRGLARFPLDLKAKPFHLTSWLDENPQIRSDWTKAHVIAVIQRPFNRAVRQRLIATNPFRGVIVQLLISNRARQEPGEFVICTHRGTCWNRCNLSLRMQRARAAAKIPDDAKRYGLRHRFGTMAIVNGVDIKTLAELMGHTSVKLTEHYVALAGRQSHLAVATRKATGQDRAE